MARRAALLAIVLLALVPVSAQDGDWGEALRNYRRDIKPENPLPQRLQAVYSLSYFATPESARILLSTVEATERTEAPLIEEKADVEKQIERILGRKQFDEVRKIPAETMNGLKALQERLSLLQRKITNEARVRQEIGVALGEFREPKAVTYLMRDALGHRSGRVREIAAKALGDIRDSRSLKPLLGAAQDRLVSVREAALEALGKLGHHDALPVLLEALEHKAWPLRAAAVRALGQLAAKESVGPLIAALGREEGRLQKDVADVLEDLTGQKFGVLVDAWRRWWEENKGRFGGEGGLELGGKGKRSGVSYYGITTYSKRIVYVLDVSGSMAQPHVQPSGEAGNGEILKVDAAKRELIRSLRTIPKDGAFTIIVYNDLIKVWKPKLVTASPGNKKAAETFVNGLGAAQSTNIYGALEAVFKLAGMGATDRRYDLGADTVFLLTDGSPTQPDGQPDSTEKIIVACREWNRLKRVQIHCIGIGRQHNGAFLGRLARENGGQYVAR
jgi:HEAT repeat protein